MLTYNVVVPHHPPIIKIKNKHASSSTVKTWKNIHFFFADFIILIL